VFVSTEGLDPFSTPGARTDSRQPSTANPSSRNLHLQIAGVREEPRMREQDFGNLQDDRMPVTKMQRNAYGCGPSPLLPVVRPKSLRCSGAAAHRVGCVGRIASALP